MYYTLTIDMDVEQFVKLMIHHQMIQIQIMILIQIMTLVQIMLLFKINNKIIF